MHPTQKNINHVALVLDASTSMREHKSRVIEVADEQIRVLALRSEELQQETRVSVYTFSYANRIECLLFDMDVMRLPSIKSLYHVDGMTALVDATFKSQEDLATTSQIYGDHAFLTFVITDGDENDSVRHGRSDLGRLATSLSPGHSMGFLVPQADRYGRGDGRMFMRRLGVPDDMIQEWNAADINGFVGAGAKVAAATESFMASRAAGRTITRSAFSTGDAVVNAATVQAALDPLVPGTYTVVRNNSDRKITMKDFMEENGLVYRHGTHFYELTNATRALIQPDKQIVIVDRKTQRAFSDDRPGSPRVREMIGLSKTDRMSVSASANKQFQTFVQSTNATRLVREYASAFVREPKTA